MPATAMNAGRAITKAMRYQRAGDWGDLLALQDVDQRYAFQAWLWWGWAIYGNRHLGYPGSDT